MRASQAGFTLIELMIVVAVIAILAALAYPAYERYVENTRRVTAQADLLELAQFMERQYSVNNSYEDVSLPFTQSPREGDTAFYTLSLAEQGSNRFRIEATPSGPQSGDRCGTLSVTQANRQDAAEADCWQ